MSRLLSALVFFALFLILEGFALAVLFEALAIFTGKESSLSQLASGAIAHHWPLALFSTLVIGTLLGALATHFTHWSP